MIVIKLLVIILVVMILIPYFIGNIVTEILPSEHDRHVVMDWLFGIFIMFIFWIGYFIIKYLWVFVEWVLSLPL